MSKFIPSIPFREIGSSSQVDNIIHDVVIYEFFKNDPDSPSECPELTINEVKEVLKKNPDGMKKITEDHVKLIILSGDVELFKRCYALPQFAKLSLNSSYFINIFKQG